MNNVLVNFIAEFVLRLFSSKPKFFVIIQWVSIVTGGLATLLSYAQTVTAQLPSWVTHFSNANVIVASAVALILSQLTNKDPKVSEKIEALHGK